MKQIEPTLVRDATRLWHSTTDRFPGLSRPFSAAEQSRCEARAADYLDRIDDELRTRPTSGAKTIIDRTIPHVVAVAAICLDLDDPRLDTLLKDGFTQIGIELARWARRLDPDVSTSDILQACRNAWTAGGLQLLLGREFKLTPAIFGYSMLYPYSDNYLDDPDLSSTAKFEFSRRFRARLHGETLPPLDHREAIIWTLVTTIESEYDRSLYPEVYESLLAIHAAQEGSLRQSELDRPDIEHITIAKGGTSVLADAYLAAGTLTPAERIFAFNWGVLLQLTDDLQDLKDDRERTACTLFTQSAGRFPLDALTNRVFHFGESVRDEMTLLPSCAPFLRELLTRSSRALLIRSVGANARFYSAAYVSMLERYSPLRFDFLEKREQWFSHRSRTCARMFDLFIAQDTEVLAS